MAHQYRIRARRVELAIGFVDQFEMRDRSAASEYERLGEARDLPTDDANRLGIQDLLRKNKTRLPRRLIGLMDFFRASMHLFSRIYIAPAIR